MILPEYLGKSKLMQHGIPTPKGEIAHSADQASSIAQWLGGQVVIKVQIPSGGRGKAGGIRFAHSSAEARSASAQLLGSRLLGHRVGAVLVEELIEVRQEMYLSLTVNAASGAHLAIFSPCGGMEIEELAISDPQSIRKISIDPLDSLKSIRRDGLLLVGGLDEGTGAKLLALIESLYNAYVEMDCILAEINPLALLPDGRIIALDCKIEVDDNALYRHPDLQELRNETMDQRQRRAAALGVTYIPLDGDVGVIGSGAGLGMATLDMIRLAGMKPANFLDTGGGITEELMREAVRLVLEPKKVRGGIINLYGGINPMVAAAEGIITALREDSTLRKPLVVKILGNQQEEAWELLERAGIATAKTVRTEDAVRQLALLLERSRG